MSYSCLTAKTMSLAIAPIVNPMMKDVSMSNPLVVEKDFGGDPTSNRHDCNNDGIYNKVDDYNWKNQDSHDCIENFLHIINRFVMFII